MKRLFILCILCLLSLSVQAQRFALLDFQLGTNVTAEEIDALTYNFRANFYIDGYRDIPFEPVIKRSIEELGFDRFDMTRQQMLKLGRRLTAKLVVVGVINKLMDEYTVEVSALDVSTGLTVATEGATFVKSDYRRVMEALASKLGEKLASSTDSGTSVSFSAPSSRTVGSKVGYADLGLSVKWATCNLGANKPEEYGDYYAWGETETKMTYDWSVYKWCNGSKESLTKYNTSSSYGRVDNKTVLDASDDVVRVKLGGKWRMPTYWEWMELCEYCTWTSVNQNGINGRLVTSPNGNSIFLPAAGCRMGTDTSEDSCGFYWSSTLGFNDPSCALSLGFGLNDVLYEGKNRFYGFSVRPVYAE